MPMVKQPYRHPMPMKFYKPLSNMLLQLFLRLMDEKFMSMANLLPMSKLQRVATLMTGMILLLLY